MRQAGKEGQIFSVILQDIEVLGALIILPRLIRKQRRWMQVQAYCKQEPSFWVVWSFRDQLPDSSIPVTEEQWQPLKPSVLNVLKWECASAIPEHSAGNDLMNQTSQRKTFAPRFIQNSFDLFTISELNFSTS